MTRRQILRDLIRLAVMLAPLWWLTACRPPPGAEVNPDVDYYTCTMHPSVRAHDPGKCPLCAMDLVPVLRRDALETGVPKAAPGSLPSEFSVPVERQQQIGVTFATAENRPLRRDLRAVGVVAPDKSRQWSFVARFEGYVQTLHVTSPGEPVAKDQPLLTLYSPELLMAESEFIHLPGLGQGQAEAKSALLEAGRKRLARLNMTTAQIAALEKSRTASDLLTLLSPFQGVVEDVPVEQGRKVVVGDHLVEVADLSVIWVWAEFYEDELSLLAKGQKVRLTAKAYPGESFEGELSLINPFLTGMQRTVKVRVDIPNADFKLRPGMYVNIELAMDLGEGLTIPVGAIMPTGLRSLAFVDKGEGKLEPRPVQLGRKFGELYEVLAGLKEGERVVASANFLIDAESKVQGAVKSFEVP